jgi:mono/diheme cytochrome c family protein
LKPSYILAGILFIALATSAWSQSNPGAGKEIYERLCVSCHGSTGRGGRMAGMLPVPPRNLADTAYMQGRSEDQLFTVVKDGSAALGLSDAMPGFGNQLNDQEIRDTVAYVQTLAAAHLSATAQPETESAASAQRSGLRITRLQLSIWPEYDDPRVLLIVRGELAPGVAYPTHVTLPIPKGAELIGAGMISELGELLLHPHRVIPGDASDSLEITLPSPGFFAELYFDPFEASGDAKRFGYTFEAPYPINQFDVDIQMPYTASEFGTEPPAMAQETEGRDTTYHRFAYRDVAAGQPTTFTVSYVKTDPQPSVPKAGSPPAADSPAARGPQDRLLIYFGILAGVTAAYVLGTLLWIAYRRRRAAPTSPETQPLPLTAPSVPPPVAPAAANFCSHCGRALDADYAFCPGCGHAAGAS